MKTSAFLWSITLFAVGFVLINGYHNLFCVFFVSVLAALFIVIPILNRISHFLKGIRQMKAVHEQWA